MDQCFRVHGHLLRRGSVCACPGDLQRVAEGIRPEGQNPHIQSRFSVKVAYDYIYNLPDEDFVYIVDDDHLHYPDAIKRMLITWEYLDHLVNVIGPRDALRKSLWSSGLSDEETNLQVDQFDGRTHNDIGIFPQCFVQMLLKNTTFYARFAEFRKMLLNILNSC